MFEKVLIANRGEIAVRVARTLKEMGIGSVAVYSEADRDAPHVREADEAFLIGPAVPAESYLSIAKIVETATQPGAEAIHPGYGFLAENAEFARACDEAGIVFIGPPAEAIEAMGSKTRAREIMAEAGVPIVPGATEPAEDLEEARAQAEDAGYPVACKAAGGGGGKGFRVALTPDDLEEAFEGAAREGEKFFSDAARLRRALPRGPPPRRGPGPRRLARQRDPPRRARLLDPAPPPEGDRGGPGTARRRGDAGADRQDRDRRRRVRSATDRAGTIEGLQVGDDYFFLEMNTRVQVEHCVTEMVTGFDIVREQVRIAAGEELSISQERGRDRGHAIECRINAEAAHKNFAPSPGRDRRLPRAGRPGVRVDSGSRRAPRSRPMYDPMVAKLIVWDVDREHATRRMLRALGEYEIGGLTTLIPFHEAILATDQWAKRRDLPRPDGGPRLAQDAPPPRDAAAPGREPRRASREGRPRLQGRGRGQAVRRQGLRRGIANAGAAAAAQRRPPRRERKAGGGGGASSESLPSPLQGTVLRVAVEQGAEVEEGALICVIEAMKMENEITAHRSGKVTELGVSEGASVSSGDVIAVIT